MCYRKVAADTSAAGHIRNMTPIGDLLGALNVQEEQQLAEIPVPLKGRAGARYRARQRMAGAPQPITDQPGLDERGECVQPSGTRHQSLWPADVSVGTAAVEGGLEVKAPVKTSLGQSLGVVHGGVPLPGPPDKDYDAPVSNTSPSSISYKSPSLSSSDLCEGAGPQQPGLRGTTLLVDDQQVAPAYRQGLGPLPSGSAYGNASQRERHKQEEHECPSSTDGAMLLAQQSRVPAPNMSPTSLEMVPRDKAACGVNNMVRDPSPCRGLTQGPHTRTSLPGLY